MTRSLSLAAYMAFARRAGPAPPPPETPRPDGPLIWAHAIDPERADTLIDLSKRLVQHRASLHMILTGPGPAPQRLDPRGAVIWQEAPDDTGPAADVFLDHWRPDICLWTGGDLKPALLIHAAERDIPLYLVDADEARLDRTTWRWAPDLPRAVLGRFAEIHARSDSAARLLRRLGAPNASLRTTGPFLAEALTLPHDMSDREEMARILRGRPVWLAAMVQAAELYTVLDAHENLGRVAHRSLLILVPDDMAEADTFARHLSAAGWRHVRWSQGEMPGEATQVVLADAPGEMGLWYRLAPVAFMGSSLMPGYSGRDPNEPAAHGSAIIHGPHVARYRDRYARYARADAARRVEDAETLFEAVQALMPPDRSALMAQAAWNVASKGAAVTDRIVDMLLDRLDRQAAAR
ncbi:3-deoxy-D-manno-octulosonic acid transferase [Roseovarius sp. D22-M7]|uniref:3-deoxy-D-manno-octulosonic acid transferase n=1 Tax=Roseovarius sp. D22-M7 TaxID=3127116 RepID=UPI00300FA5AA